MSEIERRTVVFVDLAGFTTLTSAHGDSAAADVAEGFADMARAELRGEDRFVKSIGDAVMLVALSPAEGLSLVGRLCARADSEIAFPVLRSGLHHGPVVRRGDDWFGGTVNAAARIAALAAGGQVLGTFPIAQAAREQGVAVKAMGAIELRGLPEPFELFDVVPCAPLPSRLVDPVCRMAMTQSNAVARLRHGEQEQLFCSTECLTSFVADPVRFVRVEPVLD